MRTENELWEFLGKWVKGEVKENEEITTGYGPHQTVRIGYSRISDNRLFQNNFEAEMRLLRVVSERTLNSILDDILDKLRRDDI